MSSETNDSSRDESTPTDDDPTNAPHRTSDRHPHRTSDRQLGHAPDTRRRVLATTLRAETELLERQYEELAATNEELEAEVEDLESELERKRRELREVVTRYERLLAEHREVTRENDDDGWNVRSDGSAVFAAATRMCHRVFYPRP